MRIIVCGGRKYADRDKLWRVLDDLRKEGEFELGVGYDPNDPKFQGADQLAYEWALDRGVSGRCYPAHWSVYGNAAGPMRNERMFRQFGPNEVWAWPGWRGTENMMDVARRNGVPVITVGADGRTSRGQARTDTAAMKELWNEVCGPKKDYPPTPTGFGRPRNRR